MKVTENFDSTEFDQPERHGFPKQSYPEDWIPLRLLHLCKMLELIRSEFGNRPIKILSGYRSANYNSKIGGAKQSQHVEGRAADISIKGLSAEIVFKKIQELCRSGRLPMIRGLGKYPTFTHVDIRPTTTLVRWEGSRTVS